MVTNFRYSVLNVRRSATESVKTLLLDVSVSYRYKQMKAKLLQLDISKCTYDVNCGIYDL